ncbi:MAG: type II secretion system F family protein [Spirochaetaceae bacterium]|jgi:type II secretory pathway component PulF|nr:type II secretion system F family protein [Spirochaetaceae bacterium]
MNKYKSKTAVLEFTEMMETLLESGLSLRDALELLSAGEGADSGAAFLAGGILDRVRSGVSFAQAVFSMNETFPPIYRGMIRVGYKAGSVERIFPRLGAYLRDRKKLREKTAAALAYPLLVLSIAIAGSIGLVFFVLPRMEAIFGSFGGGQAETIRGNIAAMETAMIFFAGLVLFAAASAIAVKKLNGFFPGICRYFDRIILRLPLTGGFFSAWESLNFSFAMEVLTSGGVSVEAALGEAGAVVSNSAYREALREVQEEVLNGVNLSQAFRGKKLFPSRLGRWIAIGESSGQTESIFSQVRSYFQEEIDRRMNRFLLLIEPALIALIGAVILFFVVAVVLPLFSAYGNIL